MTKKRVLVISAVNIVEGGTLTVLDDAIDTALKFLVGWDIYVLVNNKKYVKKSKVSVMEFPKAKLSWFIRLYYEWFQFNKLSKLIEPDLWVSLHDITPRVFAKRQIVYCHNPSPFYKINIREAIQEPKFLLFNFFYKYLYGINIHNNYLIIVQQEWIRDKFKKLYGDIKIIVSHPLNNSINKNIQKENKKITFFYPALPRVFKNFEIICEATEIINKKFSDPFEIIFTIDGNENKYSRYIYRRYKHLKNIKFHGRMDRESVYSNYSNCDAVIFPSKLETWGLPITEAKSFDKPLLLIDLPYAHETLGEYANANFFKAGDAEGLAKLMLDIIRNEWRPTVHNFAVNPDLFASGWQDLWATATENL